MDSAMASTVRPASMSEEMRVRQVMAPKLQNSVAQRNSILLQDSVTVPPMDTTVGDRVRMARQAKGLTMNELAKAIGKKESYISELERGGIKRGSQLYRIADVLGAPLSWLESGTGNAEYVLGLVKATESDAYKALMTASTRTGSSVSEPRNESVWDFYGEFQMAPPETRAAVELLLLPRADRAALIGPMPALVAGIELLEAHAAHALRKRKSA